MLSNPAAFFAANRWRLVVLDEIQEPNPQILSELRAARLMRTAPRAVSAAGPGLFAASNRSPWRGVCPGIWHPGGERGPLSSLKTSTLWLRGGYPNSYLAAHLDASVGLAHFADCHILNTDCLRWASMSSRS